jgi:hypothetical protein
MISYNEVLKILIEEWTTDIDDEKLSINCGLLGMAEETVKTVLSNKCVSEHEHALIVKMINNYKNLKEYLTNLRMCPFVIEKIFDVDIFRTIVDHLFLSDDHIDLLLIRDSIAMIAGCRRTEPDCKRSIVPLDLLAGILYQILSARDFVHSKDLLQWYDTYILPLMSAVPLDSMFTVNTKTPTMSTSTVRVPTETEFNPGWHTVVRLDGISQSIVCTAEISMTYGIYRANSRVYHCLQKSFIESHFKPELQTPWTYWNLFTSPEKTFDDLIFDAFLHPRCLLLGD